MEYTAVRQLVYVYKYNRHNKMSEEQVNYIYLNILLSVIFIYRLQYNT